MATMVLDFKYLHLFTIFKCSYIMLKIFVTLVRLQFDNLCHPGPEWKRANNCRIALISTNTHKMAGSSFF